MVDQLTKHISIVKPLSRIQHDFRQDRSIVANLLACDATFARHLDKSDPFDIKSFDYQKAFDKIPYDLMFDLLYKLNIHPTTLAWFASFFSGRTFQVVVDGVASKPTDVTSGAIKGSVLSPVCFCIFLDLLLQAVSELTGPVSYGFADNFKFVTGTSPSEHQQLNLLSILSTASLRILECLGHLIKAVFCITAIIIQSCSTFSMAIRYQ